GSNGTKGSPVCRDQSRRKLSNISCHAASCTAAVLVMTPSRSNRQPRMPSGSPSTGQAYESPAWRDMRGSPPVDPGRQLAHRPLVGAGVADHHRYAILVPALDQRHAVMAARLSVGTARGEGAPGPGQVLLPCRRPDDVLDAHGSERVRRL